MTWQEEEITKCDICGESAPTSESRFVEGKSGTICEDCVGVANKALSYVHLGTDSLEKFPFILQCLTYGSIISIEATDQLGLGNPAFITRALLSQRFGSMMEFLEFVFITINTQVESAISLPDGFENGLVHVLHEGMSLCGFSRNTPTCWPKNHTFTTADNNFEGVTCMQCQALIQDRFPDHPALTQ
ncbi:MAG: hypothetical protein JWL80_478 [Parcubacteria group bacterium]|nr:hypothetical protein [Parcubacteria group bacterium]